MCSINNMRDLTKVYDVLACQGCLALHCKLSDIREKRLLQDLRDLTGLPVSGGLLCSMCMHLVYKFKAFRLRCRNSWNILIKLPLNKDALSSVDRSSLTVPLSRSKMCQISCKSTAILSATDASNQPVVIDISEVEDDAENSLEKTQRENIEDIGFSEVQMETVVNTNANHLTDVFANEVEQTDITERYETIDNENDDTDDANEDYVETFYLNDSIDNVVMSDDAVQISMNDADYDSEQTYIDDEDHDYVASNIDESDKDYLEFDVDDEGDSYLETNIADADDNVKIDMDADGNIIETNIDHSNDVETDIGYEIVDYIEPAKQQFAKNNKPKFERDKNQMNYFFMDIWKTIDKVKDDYYQMFERLYKLSLEEKLPETNFEKKANHSINLKTEDEVYFFTKFLNRYREIAESYKVDVEILSIMEERRAMDEKRKTLAKDSGDCGLCLKKYRSAGTRERHMKRSHNEDLPLRCEVCLYTFKQEHSLVMHLFKFHCTRRQCRECDKPIVSIRDHTQWSEVVDHINMYHRPNNTTCEFCGRTFPATKHCLIHIRYAHLGEMQAVQCLLCGDFYKGPPGLRTHVVRIHFEAVKCATCGVYFQNKEAMAAHVTATGKCQIDISACPMCGATFPTESLMKEHYDDTHAKYKCKRCNRTFIEQDSYKVHKLRICSEKVVRKPPEKKKKEPAKKRTENIDKSAPKKKKKRYYYPNNQIFICEVCGKSAPNLATLKYHMRIHTGEKPFKCKDCDKTFRMRCSLLIHSWTHTGERRYKCQFCPKSFRQSTHLQAHMPSHTNEKKYACEMCEKRYTSKYTLRDHVRSVHEGLPLKQRIRKKKLNKIE